ncbi:hypothetical protein C0993_008315, partial [Termitomyces sp. T159_Od127]
MERPSSPLSERSYAEAVTGSPPRRTPPLTKGELQQSAQKNKTDHMQIDTPPASSPEIPLSSMPLVSTQEQLDIEESVKATKTFEIEVDDTLGRASEDVNALLQNKSATDGWQTVTPRKNRKKTKLAAKRFPDSNKRPHSDSPLKERSQKRLATESGSDISGDEGGYRRTLSPTPALSTSNLSYTDTTQKMETSRGTQNASITPRAEATKSGRTVHQDAETDSLPRTGPQHGKSNRDTELRGESPMKISSPSHGTHNNDGYENPDEDDPELWFETTEGDITTNGKGFRRTATPPGGWPKVHLAADPAYNIATETLNEWEDIAEPTIWARLYRARYEPTEAGKTRAGDQIKKVIKNLVYVEHDESVAVIFPEQNLPPSDGNRYPHPYHLLIVGLDPQQAQRLLDLEVVASTEATVFFLPRNPPRQLYILTMGGLTYNNTEGARGLVEDLAKRTFRTSPEIRAIIESNSNLPTEDALDRILDIRASFLPVKQRTGTTRCWNLYFINDPGYDEEEYRLLRRKMRACTFKTLTFGKGYALTGANEQPLCTGCKSADHDSYNCPYSRLPGWLGYRPNGRGDTAGTTDFIDERPDEDRPRNYSIRARGRG